jgi:hypothetical protein
VTPIPTLAVATPSPTSPTLIPPIPQSSMAPFVWPTTEAPTDGSAAPFRQSLTTVLIAFCFGLIRMLA